MNYGFLKKKNFSTDGRTASFITLFLIFVFSNPLFGQGASNPYYLKTLLEEVNQISKVSSKDCPVASETKNEPAKPVEKIQQVITLKVGKGDYIEIRFFYPMLPTIVLPKIYRDERNPPRTDRLHLELANQTKDPKLCRPFGDQR